MCRLFLSTFLIALALAQPSRVLADAKEEAKKHFDRGIGLVDDGQLQQALVEFQRSYDLTHHYAVLYNMAQVLVSLAQPVEAVDTYEQYLADGGASIDRARQAAVRKEIARQRARIATLTIHVVPDGARVSLDGKELGKAPLAAPVRVGVGSHVIGAAADGHDPAEVAVTVAGEDQRVIELALRAQAVSAPPPPATEVLATPLPPPAPPRDDGWLLGRTWTWVAAGTTVVLGAGAATAGLLMQSKRDDLSKSCGKDSPARLGCSESDISTVTAYRNTANVLWVLTGAAAVTTATLFFVEGRSVAAAPMVGEVNGLLVNGRF